MEFEWDEEKQAQNMRKHGVGFAEASTVFGDPLEITVSDPDHSLAEHRFLSVGLSRAGAYWSCRTSNAPRTEFGS